MERLLQNEALDILFRSARTHRAWLPRTVSDELLRRLYELMKWAPTSADCSPARILFLRTPEAKERLRPALGPRNVEKTMTAPVTAIIAYDLRFFDKMHPDNPLRERFANSPDISPVTAFRNGTLQGGYFILAARALGLDCGPLSGFDNAKVDAEFFPAPMDHVKSNFICNLGYGDESKLGPRGHRLTFEDACSLL
jgi:3-hydroxypropanoate dehydrogenase